MTKIKNSTLDTETTFGLIRQRKLIEANAQALHNLYNPVRCGGISKYFFTWLHILISCSRSGRTSASSSLWVSLSKGMMGMRQWWKGTALIVGVLMVWCSGWGRDKIETCLSGGESDQSWDDLFIAVHGESGYPGRMVWGSGADLMFQFRLERGGDGTKCCQEMNQRQWVCLGSMGRKCNTAWWRDDVRQRRGSTGEGKERRRHQLDGHEFYWVKK
jgi:hypothetical protein